MTEHRATDPFETRLAGLVHAYVEVATDRPIDALEVSRTAMSSRRAVDWHRSRLWGLSGRPGVDARWAVVGLGVLLLGVAGFGVLGRPSTSTAPSLAVRAAPIPDVLRHTWQRPLPVAPGPDVSGGSGVLDLTRGQFESRPDPAGATSRSAITATSPDTVAVTATAETLGCAAGDTGAYRWLLEGKGTVLTLTAIGSDACAAREQAVIGRWVRSDLPPPADPGGTMSPGTHQTTGFDPVGGPSAPSRLTYTVGEGWKVKEDRRTTLTLDHIVDGAGAQPPTGPILVLMADPVMTADLDAGAPCGPIADAPAVGTGLDDLVAAIRARPGVVSTPPATVTIGGHRAQVLDLQLAPSWTGGCRAPEGLIVGLPLLRDAGSTAGPVVGLGTDRPLRLILVDVGDGRTMVGAIFDIGTTRPAEFAADVAQSMPIVEGLEFRPAPP